MHKVGRMNHTKQLLRRCWKVQSRFFPSFLGSYFKPHNKTEAVEIGNLPATKKLLKRADVQPDANQNICVGLACQGGVVFVIPRETYLTSIHPSPDLFLNLPQNSELVSNRLNLILLGHLEIVKLLLSIPEVDPSADNHFAFLVACKYGHAEIVRLLLKDKRMTCQWRRCYWRH
jgi:ankyrin repeat protein